MPVLHVLATNANAWQTIFHLPKIRCPSFHLRESVLHEETGLLVQHGDVGALAEAVEALVSNAEQRQRMSDSAREFAEGFSWDVSARRLEAVLGRVSGLTKD